MFEAGLDAPDPNRHPAALLARGFECILEAGKSRVYVSTLSELSYDLWRIFLARKHIRLSED